MPEESFLFDDEPIDPEIQRLIDLEDERQARKLQMIPSESICPRPVLAALATSFSNKYAEGYPSTRMSRHERHRLADVDRFLGFHRRYGDRRYYKGTEFVDFVEAVAQQRCADLFATPSTPAKEIFANVQPLSGAPANNAVYEALCNPYDVVMGMHLSYGGHLTHGSPFNRSGKYYKVHAYIVNEATGRLDYDLIRRQALEVEPRLVVAGASAYPWTIEWTRMREIADAAGAYLLADISHPAGLVAAGLFPNPVGVADVTMFTTHKTLCGPRGAVLVSTNADIARRLNTAVFPGEQGGPHANSIAAKAVAFRLAATERFRRLQRRIVENAAVLAEAFRSRDLPLAYGGTDTHLCLVDLRKIPRRSGVPLTADIASNILDLCGITANKNALPGDATGVRPSGVRFGTVVLSQRGMGPSEMRTIAALVAKVLRAVEPFEVEIATGRIGRGKVASGVMREAQEEVARLASAFPPHPPVDDGARAFVVRGERARAFLHQAAAADLRPLDEGRPVRSRFLDEEGVPVEEATILREADGYRVAGSTRLRRWLEMLSDGYVRVHREDAHAKVHGPVAISPADPAGFPDVAPSPADPTKAFYVGRKEDPGGRMRIFEFEPEEGPEKKTPLWTEHKRLGARLLPFAGHSMPGWYAGTQEEHQAVRSAAGLFDVGHMGTLEVAGPDAAAFLDTLTTNFVPKLEIGQSHYTYVLDVDGRVMDDIIIYRTGEERFLVVVNASNQDKIWAWWTAVNGRDVSIDRDAPEKVAPGPVTLRRLKDPTAGRDQVIDLAFQGRASLPILRRLAETEGERKALDELARFRHVPVRLAGIDVLVSHTGYTGEATGFELFVHPDHAVSLWTRLLEEGKGEGVRPCGLAARDSTRTEAGFPLYGHELSGRFDLTPRQAGYGGFVKRHKPFFVGKQPLMDKDERDTSRIVRFEMKRTNIKMVRPDDPVVNRKGVCVGYVTSCVLIGRTQRGLALVEQEYAEAGTEFGIFILPHRGADEPEPPRGRLRVGDRVLLHEDATVLTRFWTPS